MNVAEPRVLATGNKNIAQRFHTFTIYLLPFEIDILNRNPIDGKELTENETFLTDDRWRLLAYF
jgi:hypothetical protein